MLVSVWLSKQQNWECRDSGFACLYKVVESKGEVHIYKLRLDLVFSGIFSLFCFLSFGLLSKQTSEIQGLYHCYIVLTTISDQIRFAKIHGKSNLTFRFVIVLICLYIFSISWKPCSHPMLQPSTKLQIVWGRQLKSSKYHHSRTTLWRPTCEIIIVKFKRTALPINFLISTQLLICPNKRFHSRFPLLIREIARLKSNMNLKFSVLKEKTINDRPLQTVIGLFTCRICIKKRRRFRLFEYH